MNIDFLTLLIVFITGGILGFLLECYTYPIATTNCNDIVSQILGFCTPFKVIYAIGFALIYILNQIFSSFNINFIIKVIIITFIITLFECIGGVASDHVNGERPWDYGTKICYGYTDPEIVICWFLIVMIACFIFDSIS